MYNSSSIYCSLCNKGTATYLLYNIILKSKINVKCTTKQFSRVHELIYWFCITGILSEKLFMIVA